MLGDHQCSGHEFEQTPGGYGGQRSLACHSPRDLKELDMTYRLNNNKPGQREEEFSFLFLAMLRSTWDLGSLTRDCTRAPYSGGKETGNFPYSGGEEP